MAAPLVVGYDGSDGANAALDEAAALARDLGAELIVGFAYGASALGGEVSDLVKTLRERGQAVCDTGVARARAAGVEARGELVDDKPGEGLVALAAAEGARMIVVGSRGEGLLRGAILGSTSHRLVHVAHVPVLVVRQAD